MARGAKESIKINVIPEVDQGARRQVEAELRGLGAVGGTASLPGDVAALQARNKEVIANETAIRNARALHARLSRTFATGTPAEALDALGSKAVLSNSQDAFEALRQANPNSRLVQNQKRFAQMASAVEKGHLQVSVGGKWVSGAGALNNASQWEHGDDNRVKWQWTNKGKERAWERAVGADPTLSGRAPGSYAGFEHSLKTSVNNLNNEVKSMLDALRRLTTSINQASHSVNTGTKALPARTPAVGSGAGGGGIIQPPPPPTAGGAPDWSPGNDPGPRKRIKASNAGSPPPPPPVVMRTPGGGGGFAGDPSALISNAYRHAEVVGHTTKYRQVKDTSNLHYETYRRHMIDMANAERALRSAARQGDPDADTLLQQAGDLRRARKHLKARTLHLNPNAPYGAEFDVTTAMLQLNDLKGISTRQLSEMSDADIARALNTTTGLRSHYEGRLGRHIGAGGTLNAQEAIEMQKQRMAAESVAEKMLAEQERRAQSTAYRHGNFKAMNIGDIRRATRRTVLSGMSDDELERLSGTLGQSRQYWAAQEATAINEGRTGTADTHRRRQDAIIDAERQIAEARKRARDQQAKGDANDEREQGKRAARAYIAGYQDIIKEINKSGSRADTDAIKARIAKARSALGADITEEELKNLYGVNRALGVREQEITQSRPRLTMGKRLFHRLGLENTFLANLPGFRNFANISDDERRSLTDQAGRHPFHRAYNSVFNRANHLVTNVSQMGGLSLYGMGMVGATTAITGKSFAAYSEMENTKLAMTGMVNTYMRFLDAQGKAVDNQENLNKSLNYSVVLYEKVRQRASSSLVTQHELAEGFFTGAPNLMRRGFNDSQSMYLTERMLMLGKLMNLPSSAVYSDIRDIGEGQVTIKSQILQTLGVKGDTLRDFYSKGDIPGAYAYMQGKFAGFEPAFQKIEQTPQGQLNKLNIELQRVSQDIGMGVAPPLLDALGKLRDTLRSLTEAGVFEKLGSSIGSFVNTAVTMFSNLLPSITPILSNFTTTITTILGGALAVFSTQALIQSSAFARGAGLFIGALVAVVNAVLAETKRMNSAANDALSMYSSKPTSAEDVASAQRLSNETVLNDIMSGRVGSRLGDVQTFEGDAKRYGLSKEQYGAFQKLKKTHGDQMSYEDLYDSLSVAVRMDELRKQDPGNPSLQGSTPLDVLRFGVDSLQGNIYASDKAEKILKSAGLTVDEARNLIANKDAYKYWMRFNDKDEDKMAAMREVWKLSYDYAPKVEVAQNFVRTKGQGWVDSILKGLNAADTNAKSPLKGGIEDVVSETSPSGKPVQRLRPYLMRNGVKVYEENAKGSQEIAFFRSFRAQLQQSLESYDNPYMMQNTDVGGTTAEAQKAKLFNAPPQTPMTAAQSVFYNMLGNRKARRASVLDSIDPERYGLVSQEYQLKAGALQADYSQAMTDAFGKGDAARLAVAYEYMGRLEDLRKATEDQIRAIHENIAAQKDQLAIMRESNRLQEMSLSLTRRKNAIDMMPEFTEGQVMTKLGAILGMTGDQVKYINAQQSLDNLKIGADYAKFSRAALPMSEILTSTGVSLTTGNLPGMDTGLIPSRRYDELQTFNQKAAVLNAGDAEVSLVKNGEFNPVLKSKVDQLVQQWNASEHAKKFGKIGAGSGGRDIEDQRKKWEAALKKYGSAKAASKWVAPPGQSNHQWGLATDLTGPQSVVGKRGAKPNPAARAAIEAMAKSLGLEFPMSWEPWHVQAVGMNRKALGLSYGGKTSANVRFAADAEMRAYQAITATLPDVFGLRGTQFTDTASNMMGDRVAMRSEEEKAAALRAALENESLYRNRYSDVYGRLQNDSLTRRLRTQSSINIAGYGKTGMDRTLAMALARQQGNVQEGQASYSTLQSSLSKLTAFGFIDADTANSSLQAGFGKFVTGPEEMFAKMQAQANALTQAQEMLTNATKSAADNLQRLADVTFEEQFQQVLNPFSRKTKSQEAEEKARKDIEKARIDASLIAAQINMVSTMFGAGMTPDQVGKMSDSIFNSKRNDILSQFAAGKNVWRDAGQGSFAGAISGYIGGNRDVMSLLQNSAIMGKSSESIGMLSSILSGATSPQTVGGVFYGKRESGQLLGSIAGAQMLGQFIGRGNEGFQAGAQVGSSLGGTLSAAGIGIFGKAGLGKLGAAAGPVGAVAGMLLGGLIGSLFGRKKGPDPREEQWRQKVVELLSRMDKSLRPSYDFFRAVRFDYGAASRWLSGRAYSGLAFQGMIGAR